ncbi:MAG: molybdate ABC transporter substrate-binding protein [Peptococcaceae bacterium]
MKQKAKILLVLGLVCGLLLAGCGGSGQQQQQAEEQPGAELHVFAAASLTDCLDEIIALYEAESNNTVVAVYESSGTLEKQIEEGADCDIFISANQKYMDKLEEVDAVNTETRKDLLGNALTLIASADKADVVVDVDSLLSDDVTVIAIGEPSDVPAGQYAQEMFENLGLWDEIQPKLVYAKNVRAVLEYVDGGDADAGFVYHTDAMLLEKGSIIGDAPEGSYTAVNYPSAIMTAAPQPEAAADFYAFLASDAAKEVFEKYGFTVL